jgi:hypothetical protein
MINLNEFLKLYEKHLAMSCSGKDKVLLDPYKHQLMLFDKVWEDHSHAEQELMALSGRNCFKPLA